MQKDELEISKKNLEKKASFALDIAKKQGATQSAISINRQKGYDLATRMQKFETLEQSDDISFSICTYLDKKKGIATTSDLSESGIKKAIDAAIRIAKMTSSDSANGLIEKKYLETNPKDLDLCFSNFVSIKKAQEICSEAEQSAFSYSNYITNSQGANFSSFTSISLYANSDGFLNSYFKSYNSLGLSVIAKKNDDAKTDYAYSINRDFQKLEQADYLGKKAAKNTISQLDSKNIKTQNLPIIFAPNVAVSIFSHFLSAISGGLLYKNLSFLNDYLGKEVFDKFINIYEDPFLRSQIASSPFDCEGAKPKAQLIIENGKLNTYLLGSYSARKLKLQPTGHSGKTYNWSIKGIISQEKLQEQMQNGLLITSVMGQGVNLLTGDYSRGARGFLIKNGKIEHPVDAITIASNLKKMFRNIKAIATDIDKNYAIKVGSILIDDITVAGNI